MFYINSDYESTEKYDLAKFMSFETDNFEPLSSYFLQELPKLPKDGTFTISVEERRPDLISNNIYGTVIYWELLLIYNQIIDFDTLIAGKEINYFNVRDLETLYFSLTSLNGNS